MKTCEIIVTLLDDSSPSVVDFSDLYVLKDDLQSIMLLWDTNCYYVNCNSKTFIVNGGRKIRFKELEDCEILYRRRNRMDVDLFGGVSEGHSSFYLIGLKEKNSERVVYLMISDDGETWEWVNSL